LKTQTFIFYFILLFALACSKKSSDNEDKGLVLAKVNSSQIYITDLKSIIPSELSGTDSTNYVKNYLNNWAENELFYQQALKYLNEEELNVDKELEAYKKELIQYKFYARLIEEKLDTLITEDEIKNYYEEHSANFVLKNNIVKVYYIKMPLQIPNFEKFKKLCYSNLPKDLEQLNSICVQYANNYFTDNNTWLLFDDLKKEMYQLNDVPEFNLQKGKIFEFQDATQFYFLKIIDVKTKNSLSPLNFEKENIKTMILNQRKQQLINSVKKGFFDEAKSNKEIILY